MEQTRRMTVISNISAIVFLEHALKKNFTKSATWTEIDEIPYQEYLEKKYADILKCTETIIVWLNLEELIPQLHSAYCSDINVDRQMKSIEQSCSRLAEYILHHTNAQIFWLLFEDYFLHHSVVTGHKAKCLVDQINYNLQKSFEKEITFIDLKYLIAERGIADTYSAKNKFRWSFPYSKYLVEDVVLEIQKQYLVELGISKKCLVLDCDGVLWGGILSEVGIENIQVGSSGFGREYQEFQRFVLALHNRGVILAICTKNDLTDIQNVFREHSGMILKEEHIACCIANWENKPDNIRVIAETLNISLESMVFVDDSRLELEAVSALVPEVVVIKYDREQMYKDFACFNLKDDICREEVMNRNATYRTDQYRQDLKIVSGSYEEYIVALKMQIDIHKALPSEYGRLAELSQRTNKCTNGVRCTLQNIKEWGGNGAVDLYSVSLADKFSNIGLVGGFCIQDNELKLFCLSCRALGRRVEEEMLEYIRKHYNVNRIHFYDTSKNAELSNWLMKNLLGRHVLENSGKSENKMLDI